MYYLTGGFLSGGYYIVILIAFVISLIAQINVSSTFSKYSKKYLKSGYSGAETAMRILHSQSIKDVGVGRISGNMTDNYNPRKKAVFLSDSVYNQRTVSAGSVAAHECGHAMQHALGYGPLSVRTAMVPIVNFTSRFSWILIFAGLIFNSYTGSVLLRIGIIFFCVAVAFQLVTLPVEFNASSRALELLKSENIMTEDEINDAGKVLRAAALTYVASVCVSIMQLLRLISISQRRD